MSKLKLSGKELRAIGFPEGPVVSIGMSVMEKNFKHHSKEEALEILKRVLEKPEAFKDDPVLSVIADQLIPKIMTEGAELSLNQNGIQFSVFGQEHIEEGAMHQMYTAAK